LPKSRRLILQSGLSAASILAFPNAMHAASKFATPKNTQNVQWIGQQENKTLHTTENIRTRLSPKLRTLCQNGDGVRQAVEFAQETKTPFALRSGGHCFEGLSQNENLIIDLRHMNRIEISQNRRRIRVQPGATLGQINDATSRMQAALPAGFCQSVGIGGHVGGGGMGLMSRQFGLACDHLHSAQIVMADGRLLTASNEQNADLFWALRGGGSGSLGVVTEFEFNLRHVANVSLFTMIWALTAKEGAKFLEAWQVWSQSNPNSIGAVLTVKNHSSDKFFFRSMMLSTGADQETKAAAQELFSFANPMQSPSIHQGSYGEVADVIWPQRALPARSYKSASDFISAPLLAPIWQNMLERMLASKIGRQTFIIDALAGQIGTLRNDETAYAHRDNVNFLLQYEALTGNSETRDHDVVDMRAIKHTLADHVTGGAYVNYPDSDLGDWPRAYWGSNLARLQSVKRKYDPDNFFTHAQSIPR
jgi:FAD/FMN-containing dehydrogenase